MDKLMKIAIALQVGVIVALIWVVADHHRDMTRMCQGWADEDRTKGKAPNMPPSCSGWWK